MAKTEKGHGNRVIVLITAGAELG